MFHWDSACLICSLQFEVEVNLGHLQELRLIFFVTTANDSQPLTVLPKKFILNATDMVDPTLSRIQYDDVKSVWATVPIKLSSLCVLAVQSSAITLR